MKSAILPLCFLVPTLVAAQADPLNAVYKPSMDTNCAHAQYNANAWITSTLEIKLRQDAGTNPGTHCTFIGYWTQNEFADFQVHWHDSGSGTTGLTVTVGNFVQAAPNSSTINCATLGKCVVYRESYFNINTPSNTQTDAVVPGGVNFNPFPSGGATGFWPDKLIPAVDPYWGQTTNAWPFTVAAGNNQSAWIDVLIPAAAPSGYYLGSVVVQTGCPGSCVTVATMPVTLAVWQWPSAQGSKMPSKPSLPSELASTGPNYLGLCTEMYNGDFAGGNTTFCGNYPDAGGTNDNGHTRVTLDAELLSLDHRYNLSEQQNIFPEAGSFATWVSLMGPMMSGTGGTHGGTVSPILPGAQANTQKMAWLSGAVPSQAVAQNWQTNFVSNGWGTLGNIPLMNSPLVDEPAGGTWTTLHNNAVVWHGYPSPGVPQNVTSNIAAADANSVATCGVAKCLENDIDIFTPAISDLEPIGGTLHVSDYATWRTGSTDGIPRKLWSYTACTPVSGTCSNAAPGPGPSGFSYIGYPGYDVDEKPTANRAFQWLTFLHGQDGELYYHAEICSGGSQAANCGYPTHPNDPWLSIKYSGGWGDGTLIYAMSVGAGNSAKPNYAGSLVTTPIIVPSMRLKHMRDGMQDYEYLHALTVAGQGSLVTTQIASWITNSYTVEMSGSGLAAARQALGNALHQITFPVPATGTATRSTMIAKARE